MCAVSLTFAPAVQVPEAPTFAGNSFNGNAYNHVAWSGQDMAICPDGVVLHGAD
jgi:hypothetical protein